MKKDVIISVRLTAELNDRLEATAKALDLSKNDVARHAIRSSVEAIERNGYKIGWPLEMGTELAPFLQGVHDLDEGEHEKLIQKQYDRYYRQLDRQKTKEIKAMIQARSRKKHPESR